MHRESFKNKSSAPCLLIWQTPETELLLPGHRGQKVKRSKVEGENSTYLFLGYNIVSKNHSIVIKKGLFFVFFFFLSFASFEKLISQVIKGDRKYFIHWKAASNIFRVTPPYRDRENKEEKRYRRSKRYKRIYRKERIEGERAGCKECTEDKISQMTTEEKFSHAFFSVPVRKTKMNETRETEIASQVVFLLFFVIPSQIYFLHFFFLNPSSSPERLRLAYYVFF